MYVCKVSHLQFNDGTIQGGSELTEFLYIVPHLIHADHFLLLKGLNLLVHNSQHLIKFAYPEVDEG